MYYRILLRKKPWRRWKHWDLEKREHKLLRYILVMCLIFEVFYGCFYLRNFIFTVAEKEYIEVYYKNNLGDKPNSMKSGLRIELRNGSIEFYHQEEVTTFDN